MKGIISKMKEFISGEESGVSLEVSNGIFINIIIALIVSILFNIMSIKSLESTFIEISKNTAIVLDSTIKEIIEWLKHINSQYSGLLGFAGSFLGGCMAILVYKWQKRHEKKQAIKRLMFLLLSTYKVTKIFEKEGYMTKLKQMEDVDKRYTRLVYDEEWRKLIVHIKNYEDTEFLVRWFFNIEQFVILDKDKLDNAFTSIRKILIKNNFKKYLDEVDIELKERFAEKENNVQVEKTPGA